MININDTCPARTPEEISTLMQEYKGVITIALNLGIPKETIKDILTRATNYEF